MIRSLIVAGALSLSTVALTVSGAALAESSGKSDQSHASSCGTAHAAQADVNGNFGFLGQDYQGAPNYHGGVNGQEPGATGYNNSHTNCQANNPS